MRPEAEGDARDTLVPNRHPARRALRVPEGGLEDGGANDFKRFEVTEAHPKDQPLSAVRVPSGPPSTSPGPRLNECPSKLRARRGSTKTSVRRRRGRTPRPGHLHPRPARRPATWPRRWLHPIAEGGGSSSSLRPKARPHSRRDTCPRRRFLNTTSPAPRPWKRRLSLPPLDLDLTILDDSCAAPTVSVSLPARNTFSRPTTCGSAFRGLQANLPKSTTKGVPGV